ncbi:hypothetical protein BU15DRAFT_67217 [Melanogaster broomeanus]|nr:hypothetical protein BU15DRAFT_67217 [Melanogaster broomeanus]
MDSLQPFFDVVQGLRTVTIFDYLYQLDDEASLAPLHEIPHLTKMQLTFIWGRRDWSFGKAVCVATRYIPFVLIPVTLSSYLWLISLERISKGALGHPDVNICHSLFFTVMITNVVAITLSQAFYPWHNPHMPARAQFCFARGVYTHLMVRVDIVVTFLLRVYAMWNRSRLVLTILCCTLAASVGALMFLFIRFSPTVTCNSNLSVSFIVLMCAEAVNTSLMLYRAYRHFRHAPNVLIQNLTRNGVFYCVIMFGAILAGPRSSRLSLAHSASRYQGVMHTILATRMQLHLRKLDWCGSEPVDGERMGRLAASAWSKRCHGTKSEAHLPEPTV